MKSAAIYCRVSTNDQALYGTSLASQLAACQQFAIENGYAVLKSIREDMSGAKLNRPGLEQIRDMAQAGQIEAVIVFDPDRLSRNNAHMYLLMDEFKREQVELLFVNSPREDTPEGNMLFGMKSLFAEYEREKIKERVRRGRMRRAHDGKVMGAGNVPYGYRYVKKNRDAGEEGHFEVVPEEAHYVKLMYEWIVEEGLTTYAVIKRLFEMGAPTRKGNGRWYRGTVSNILHAECYMGTLYWNKNLMVLPKNPTKAHKQKENTARLQRDRAEWIGAEIPPLISRELWEKAQERLEYNKVMGLRNCKTEYLLRGRLICDYCGCHMSGHNNARNRTFSYECNNRGGSRLVGGGTRCPSRAVRIETLEQGVWDTVLRNLTDPDLARKWLDGPNRAEEQTKARDDEMMTAIFEAEQALQRERDSLTALCTKHGLLEPDELAARLAPITRQLEAFGVERSQLQAKMERRQQSSVNHETLEELVELAQEGLPLLTTYDEKRKVLEMLKAEIHVGPDGIYLDGIITDTVWGISPPPHPTTGKDILSIPFLRAVCP